MRQRAPASAGSHPGLRGTALQGLPISLLKSALQKNVRLGRPVAALRVAWTLLRSVDPSGPSGPSGAMELLRRLPIIAFEDGLASPLVPPLVFLMAAHSSTKSPLPLSAAHVQLILACTLQLAACPWRETFESRGRDTPERVTLASALERRGGPALIDEDLFEEVDEEAAKDEICMEITRALLVRAAFGGMPGDVQMLHTAARVWSDRAASDRPAGVGL